MDIIYILLLSCVKYSTLLMFDVVVTVVRFLLILNIKI